MVLMTCHAQGTLALYTAASGNDQNAVISIATAALYSISIVL